MLGMNGIRYKLWLSRDADEVGGIGVVVKKEWCEKGVEV